MLEVIVIAAIPLGGLLLVLYGSFARNRWGINAESLNCPCCYTAVPPVRKPKSVRETLWGGGTCNRCGCKMDKWGRQIATLEP
jgi:hypothetical protein